jgi:predicted deacylase
MLKTQEIEVVKCEYWVEDYRVNNGHLQSKTPAPSAGIFLPAVQVGSTVKAGEIWGRIADPVSGQRTEVIVETGGFTLFTRTSGFVKKDDSLGGLLPITEPGKMVFDEH